MMTLSAVRTLLEYNDWANGEILAAAGGLTDRLLDRPIEMGLGSLRRTLLHICNGETVWLRRWRGETETPWPSEAELVEPRELRERLGKHAIERDAYLATLIDSDLLRDVTYRDSRGSLFTAARGDMVVQGITHSLHHRAQAVNMLRQLGAGLVELDYMMHRRRPV